MEVAVQIEFLVTPQLADPSSPKYGEWPPAPDRVFQALVATAAETGKDLQLLRHLESPPAIQASEAILSRTPRRFVPENFRRSDRYHQGTERYLPTVLSDSPVVTYVWQRVPRDVVEPLRAIVEQLSCVGRAASLVRGTLVDPGSVDVTWIPGDTGALTMRVPYPGRLDELCTAYQAGLRPPTPPVAGYRRAAAMYPATEWGDLMVVRPERQLAMTQTVRWADKMRRAVMSRAGDDVPPIIHGHGAHRHVAWAAIPDVGHRHASGMILGVGCWLPADVTLEERGLVGSLLMRVTDLEGIRLQLDQVGLKGLQGATWSRPSRVWATATPMALDRWPKRNLPAEEIVKGSLVAMGLPEPDRVVCDGLSPVRGAVRAREYPARNGNRFITHAIIEWARPVTGPLLIGADRYFGSGLCRPLADGR